MNYIENPNLPNEHISKVIVAGNISADTLDGLKSINIEPVFSYKSASLPPQTAFHPDMSILHLGRNRFLCSADSYDYYKLQLPDAELIRGDYEPKPKYPHDIYYNITIIKNRIFAASHTDTAAKNIVGRLLKVKQGYTKCNICIVNEEAVITSDISIYNTAQNDGMDALLIQPGYIELAGYDYGFIGGATGKVSKDILAVNGDLKTHPSGTDIVAFLRNYQINLLSLKKGILSDIGSILPIA